MNTLKNLIIKPGSFSLKQILPLLVCGMTLPAFAQLQWSSYNNSGALVTANVASGGDATYGGSVTFTIPASTQLEFVTKTFVPFSTPTAGSSAKVTFNISASGSMSGRCFGYGMFNDPGTTSQAMGYWGDFNIGGPYFECFQRSWTNLTYMVYDGGNALNSGKVNTGTPVAGTTYSGQIQVNNKNGVMQMGTSSSTVAAAGLVCNGSGVTQQSYSTTPKNGTNVAVTTFNEFAVMFNNSSASAVTLKLSSVSLVPPNPAVSSPPQNYSGSEGSTAVFTVVVNTNAFAPLGYQWYETNSSGTVVALTDGTTTSGSIISGSATTGSSAYTNTLTFSNAQAGDNNGNIFVVITNAYGSTTSSPVALNILPPTQPTNLVVSPSSVTVVAGHGTNFTANSIASPTPVYYWFDNNNNLIQSSSSATLALSNLQLTNAGTYSIIASNYLGTVSNNFTVNIIVPPCISQQPSNVLVNVGDLVNFYVVEGGCALPAPPAYQWYKGTNLLSGATATNYSIASVALSDIGNYKVVITNTAGAVTSSVAVLAIYSPSLTGSPLSPASNATGVCYDTPLSISFNQTPVVGITGKVKIYDASNPSTPVDTIDLSLNNVLGVQPRSQFFGDSQTFNYYPIIISGTNATIYPHSGVLTSNKTYFVTIDPGVIVDATNAYWPGINDSSTWQFSTKLAGPANPANLEVAADGSGDFLTVQGAVDSIPATNYPHTLIKIRDGNYLEIVNISGKTNVTFRGQSRTGTMVGYPNNNNINGTTHARMAFKVNANDVAIENMTITNSTPQGGSQAEALMIEGNGAATAAKRCVVNNCDIVSRQDTILANINASQGFFYNSKIVGNYDYVWGGGNLFFSKCTFHTITNTLAGSYNLTAARTDTAGSSSPNTPWVNPNGTTYSANGISLVGCGIEADPGVVNISLAGANGTAGGLVSWAFCQIDPGAYVNPAASLTNSYVFWQFQNTDTNGNPVSFSGLQTLTNGDPRLIAVTNVTTWFYGWTPALAPNIIGQPANVTVSQGQSANFIVTATGIPDPACQWYWNGLPIPGATGTNYNIASAVRTNAGNYTVVVSNGSGSVTSSVAVLTYTGNVAPVANLSTYVRPMGFPLNIVIAGNLATNWSDADADPLALTGGISSTNGAAVSYDSTYVHYTNANDVADEIDYTVGDGQTGTGPGIINIVVGPPPTNSVASTALNGDGSITMGFVGVDGYTYQVDAATNLTPPVVWTTVSTNTAVGGTWQFTDTRVTNYPNRFYRSAYRP